MRADSKSRPNHGALSRSRLRAPDRKCCVGSSLSRRLDARGSRTRDFTRARFPSRPVTVFCNRLQSGSATPSSSTSCRTSSTPRSAPESGPPRNSCARVVRAIQPRRGTPCQHAIRRALSEHGERHDRHFLPDRLEAGFRSVQTSVRAAFAIDVVVPADSHERPARDEGRRPPARDGRACRACIPGKQQSRRRYRLPCI